MSTRTATRFVVYHCSATRPQQDVGVAQIREWHLSRGWSDVGYHLIIRREGLIEVGRPLDAVGAHVAGHNAESVGVCLVGGLDVAGDAFDHRPDLFTPQQWRSAVIVRDFLHRAYPIAQHLGHRDLSPDADHDGKIERHEWLKTCPGFDVGSYLMSLTEA